MRIKYYYNKHLRSLLLSKFIYISSKHLIKLSNNVLQIGFKKEKLDYGLVYLFLFFITLITPLHSMKFVSIRGKKKLFFNKLGIKLNNNYAYIFLERLNVQYFPSLENWVGILHNFVLKKIFSCYYFIKIEDFSIFYELDFLVKFNFSVLQSFLNK
jgi:hypothetical protein